jgi:hypothetical protein
MKTKVAMVRGSKPAHSRSNWPAPNKMYFPQALRDAITGPELAGCDRCLLLSAIDASCQDSIAGERVRLTLRAQETGKLKGAFDIGIDLNADAARALAGSLQELVQRLGVRR